jgi:hypothetical protein
MTTEVGRKLVVLDPTVEATPDRIGLAPRLETLAGARVGLLSNSKNGVSRFFDQLEGMLRERYPGIETVRAAKPNASRGAPKETLDELTAGCAAVITAVGD